MLKKESYKAKYQKSKEYEDFLVAKIEQLKKDNRELRVQNESLRLENKRLNTLSEKIFAAGCIIAKELLNHQDAQRG